MPTTAAAREVDSPTDLSKPQWTFVVKRTLKEVKDDDLTSWASSVAFRIFLSLFPALGAAAAVFGLLVDPQQLQGMIDSLTQGFLPQSAARVVEQPLRNLATQSGTAAGTALVTGALAGLWAATTAAAQLVKALNRAYDLDEDRPFLKLRAVALALTLGLVAALAAVVVLLVLGPQIQDAVIPSAFGAVGRVLGVVVRLVAAFAVLVALFAFVYWLGPNRRQPDWRWLSPGSLVAVVGWLVLSGGFTLYVQTLGGSKYQATYGALAGVVLLLIWLQLSMLVLLVGAELDAELERLAATSDEIDRGMGFGSADPGLTIVVPEAVGAVHRGLPERGPGQRAAAPPQRPPVPHRHASTSIVTLGATAGAVLAVVKLLRRPTS